MCTTRTLGAREQERERNRGGEVDGRVIEGDRSHMKQRTRRMYGRTGRRNGGLRPASRSPCRPNRRLAVGRVPWSPHRRPYLLFRSRRHSYWAPSSPDAGSPRLPESRPGRIWQQPPRDVVLHSAAFPHHITRTKIFKLRSVGTPKPNQPQMKASKRVGEMAQWSLAT